MTNATKKGKSSSFVVISEGFDKYLYKGGS